MSNGDGSLAAAVDQRIEECRVWRNGDLAEPGQNHNLYLGGTSVTLRFCEIHHSLTGHNVKSRAHHTRVEYCYVHHSANREFDLVDAAETVRPHSDAVLLGNIIAKDPKCGGNHTVIHFGQDGGKQHNGTLHLAFNTIATPFVSPVVELSAAGARAWLLGNVVASGTRQAGQKVGGARGRRCPAEYRRGIELVLRRFFRPGDRLGRPEQPFRSGGRRSVSGPPRRQLSIDAAGRLAHERCFHGRIAGASRGARAARHGGPAAIGLAISSCGATREAARGAKRHGRGLGSCFGPAVRLSTGTAPRIRCPAWPLRPCRQPPGSQPAHRSGSRKHSRT